MSTRINVLYNYFNQSINNDIYKMVVFDLSDNAFCFYYKINALYTLDIILDNVTNDSGESDVVNHYYNYPKVTVYTYNEVIESVDEPFNGKKIYGEPFSGETYELFQGGMVRLHFEKISRTELEDIMYICNVYSKEEE